MILPTQPEIDALVNGVFDRLGVEILNVPFSLDSARSSFLKIVQKVPPSDKMQEFKDGVLWANCLELLDQDDVLLCSQEKAFCCNREPNKGLAENLFAEASEKPTGDYHFWAEFGVGVSCFQIVSLPKSEAR